MSYSLNLNSPSKGEEIIFMRDNLIFSLKFKVYKKLEHLLTAILAAKTRKLDRRMWPGRGVGRGWGQSPSTSW